jgi:hypothetical protein
MEKSNVHKKAQTANIHIGEIAAARPQKRQYVIENLCPAGTSVKRRYLANMRGVGCKCRTAQWESEARKSALQTAVTRKIE